MNNVRFDASEEEFRLIEAIVSRVMAKSWAAGITPPNRLDLEMDITATHLNGCPLRLQDLLDADNFNFAHDIGGIRTHINRETGELMNCFVPRFAVATEVA